MCSADRKGAITLGGLDLRRRSAASTATSYDRDLALVAVVLISPLRHESLEVGDDNPSASAHRNRGQLTVKDQGLDQPRTHVEDLGYLAHIEQQSLRGRHQAFPSLSDWSRRQ